MNRDVSTFRTRTSNKPSTRIIYNKGANKEAPVNLEYIPLNGWKRAINVNGR